MPELHIYLPEVEVFGARKGKYNQVIEKRGINLAKMFHFHLMGILLW